MADRRLLERAIRAVSESNVKLTFLSVSAKNGYANSEDNNSNAEALARAKQGIELVLSNLKADLKHADECEVEVFKIL